jgi:predicted nucleic acid-binding protein
MVAAVRLAASNSIRSEALELLLHDVRAGKRTEAAALQAHERMTEIKIRLLGDRVSRRTAWQIARQHDWDTFRDAEYLAITRLQADALVTVDRASRLQLRPLWRSLPSTPCSPGDDRRPQEKPCRDRPGAATPPTWRWQPRSAVRVNMRVHPDAAVAS